MTDEELARRRVDEDGLAAIERRVDTTRYSDTFVRELVFEDVPALIAEVHRLRGLIRRAEEARSVEAPGYCCWCGYAWWHPDGHHDPTCPAFPPEA